MSNPVQAAPRRPGAVVAAAAVLLLMAVGAVAYAVANLAVTPGTVDRFRVAARATGADASEIDPLVSLLRGSTALAAVVGVVVGLVLVGLALGLLAGRPGARVGAWVVSGLGLFCGCCGLAVLVGQRAAPLRLGADERVTADLLARFGDAYPGWWIPLNAALSVAQVLGYLVVAALLMLPGASAFFRRPAPTGPAAGPLPPAGPVPPAGPTTPTSGPVQGPPSSAPPYGPPSSAPPAAPPYSGPPASTPPYPGPPASGPSDAGPLAPGDGSRSPWAPPAPPPTGPGPAGPPLAPPDPSGPTPPPEDRP